MKRVIIKKIALTNFKGVRKLEINFNDTLTTISGRNGSGKTSVFDAFTWLMFGKDSGDRKAFNIKTLDKDGNPIPRIPHEVSAVLNVDGEDISLRRRYTEKWTKKRGNAMEEFTGHEEERLYNEVPMSVRDWSEKISDICTEQVFKFITNPLYFTSQKADVQRAMLFKMAGTVSDEEIAEKNNDFKTLLANLTGKTMEEYKREIQAKKRRIKAEIDGIPERIDERRRDMPMSENWLALEYDLKEAIGEINHIDKQIANKAEAYEARTAKIRSLYEQIHAKQAEKLQLETDIHRKVASQFNENEMRLSELTTKLERLKSELTHLKDTETEMLKQQIEKYKVIREGLVTEWRSILARTLKFGENEFVCPTCGRPLDIDDIERKQKEMEENFNLKKSADLQDNNRRGIENKNRLMESEKRLKECSKRIDELSAEIESVTAEIGGISTEKVDMDKIISEDENHIRLTKEISEMQAKSEKYRNIEPDTEELDKRKAELQYKADTIKAKLAKREEIERNQARIKELEQLLRSQSDELATLEGIEFTMAEFSKAKTEAVEGRINGMFSIVKFKLFDTQINGGEVETCEATVDGVPFSDLNNAMKINAGLDIINAICKAEGINAPITIDNAESINELMRTDSQIIRLVVTEDETLKIQ